MGDSGAYGGFGGMFANGPTRSMAPGVYRIPAVGHDGAAVLTNTAPVGAYRGAGRPEAAAMIERIAGSGTRAVSVSSSDSRRQAAFSPLRQYPNG